jgi:hypothetical protein
MEAPMSKKLIPLAVGAAVLFSLTACAPAAISASFDGVTLTVTLAEQSTYEGIRACVYDVTVVNESGEDIESFVLNEESTFKEPNGNIGAKNVDNPRENLVSSTDVTKEGVASGESVTFTDAFLCPEGQETTVTVKVREEGVGGTRVTVSVTV